MCNISQIRDENQRRNNLSKLTTFHPIFQLPHSALMVTHRMMGIKSYTTNTFTFLNILIFSKVGGFAEIIRIMSNNFMGVHFHFFSC